MPCCLMLPNGSVRVLRYRTQSQDQIQNTDVYLDKHTAEQGRLRETLSNINSLHTGGKQKAMNNYETKDTHSLMRRIKQKRRSHETEAKQT